MSLSPVDAPLRVLGMISGTSADAIDVALCELTHDGRAEDRALAMRLLAFDERPYPADLRERVLRLFAEGSTPLDELTELNFRLGGAFATAALDTLAAADVPTEDVDLIASHGQTIYHLVEPGRVRSTWQMGEAAVIAERTGVSVASDFRVADVAAGGHGAPLVSFLDALLLAHPDRTRAIQNIGGIGNVTFLLAGSGPEGAYAFDTGPGNALLDYAARTLSGGALPYDRDGGMAAAGRPDPELLEHALAHPYYALAPPKSTGRELFGDAYAEELLGLARGRGLAPEDAMATLAALTAQTIARAYRDFGPASLDEVIVSGGGARNPALMRLLRAALPDARVMLYDEIGMPGSIKEAVAFALLGHECLLGRPANLPSCTGASRATVLGKITPGKNYGALVTRVAASLGGGRRAPARHPYEGEDTCTPIRALRFVP